jgi:8-oxo-dGTP pyrophosphatase MutT (NUDIX family)
MTRSLRVTTPSDSRISKRKALGRGQWLLLEEVEWEHPEGQSLTWEVVRRAREQEAVMILAIAKPSGDLILVDQYRPATDAQCLEFPAGLVDPGEEHGEAALRELKEETGYHGTLDRLIPPRVVGPGVTSERISLAIVTVDENHPQNLNPQPSPEPSESIRCVRLPKSQWPSLLEDQTPLEVDAKLASFIAGVLLDV